LQEVITIQNKAYKIGELAFEDLDKKFELHLTLTQGSNISKVAITRILI
jgi:hypothetical protein